MHPFNFLNYICQNLKLIFYYINSKIYICILFKAFKYQIFPTKEQIVLIEKHFGCCRFIYNWGLERKISLYQTEKKNIGWAALQSEMVNVIKKQSETAWLTEVYSQSLQSSLTNLDMAFTRFFREKNGFPKFKSKHKKQSYQYPQGVKVNFKEGLIFLPKLKQVRICFSRTFEGMVKTTTVSRSATGKYYVSILVDNRKDLPEKKPINIETAVGIDLGIKDFAVLSTGEKFDNPKFLKKRIERLKFQQRRASRKVKGSNNRKKSNQKIAKIHERITNLRRNNLHQISTKLIKENQFDTYCIENLNVAGMLKNHNLAQAISDVSWNEFTTMLKYKAEWSGKNVITIGRFEPSSKLCSCGILNNALTLKDRTWTCENCGVTHDRDILAANNIKRMAFHPKNKIGDGTPRINACGDEAIVSSKKQESYNEIRNTQ